MEQKHTATLYSNLFIRLLSYFRNSREKAGQPAIGTALFWRWLVISSFLMFRTLRLALASMLRSPGSTHCLVGTRQYPPRCCSEIDV